MLCMPKTGTKHLTPTHNENKHKSCINNKRTTALEQEQTAAEATEEQIFALSCN